MIRGMHYMRWFREDWNYHPSLMSTRLQQIEDIENVAALLTERGVKSSRLFVYLLVTKDLENADYRVGRLKKLNVSIYAQAERNGARGIIPNAAQKEFVHRYIYGRNYKKETWREYCDRYGYDTNDQERGFVRKCRRKS